MTKAKPVPTFVKALYESTAPIASTGGDSAFSLAVEEAAGFGNVNVVLQCTPTHLQRLHLYVCDLMCGADMKWKLCGIGKPLNGNKKSERVLLYWIDRPSDLLGALMHDIHVTKVMRRVALVSGCVEIEKGLSTFYSPSSPPSSSSSPSAAIAVARSISRIASAISCRSSVCLRLSCFPPRLTSELAVAIPSITATSAAAPPAAPVLFSASAPVTATATATAPATAPATAFPPTTPQTTITLSPTAFTDVATVVQVQLECNLLDGDAYNTELGNTISPNGDVDRVITFIGVAPANTFQGCIPARALGPVNTHAKAGGAKNQKCTSRAYYKLRESLERHLHMLVPEAERQAHGSSSGSSGSSGSGDVLHGWLCGKVAVDVGSSPGGWTQYLLQAGCEKVYAIDPGEMQLGPLGDCSELNSEERALGEVHVPRMEHLMMKAQEALPLLVQRNVRVQVWVCDMNINPISLAVDMLLGHLPLLDAAAIFVLTLKNFECSRGEWGVQQQKQMSRMEEICEPGFLKVTHLLANGQDEVTVVGRIRS